MQAPVVEGHFACAYKQIRTSVGRKKKRRKSKTTLA